MNKKIFSLVLFFVAICVSISIGTSVSFAYAAEQQVTAEVAIERAYFDNDGKYDIAAFYNYSYFTSILYWEGYPSPSSTLIFTYQGKRWN